MLEINKNQFLKALQLAFKAVNPKSTIPLFTNILMDVSKEGIRLSSTDFEVSISTLCEYDVMDGEFKTAVPAKLITDFFSNIQQDKVSLNFNALDNNLFIETGNSKNKIKCVNADDFPAIAMVTKPTFKINSLVFKKAVRRVSFCTNPEAETTLAGVLLKVNKNKLILAAVDGYHLSIEELPIKSKTETEAIIKGSVLDTICKILDDEGDVEIQISENSVLFHLGNTNISSQKLNGKFPDYSAMLASVAGETTTVNISTLALLQACKQTEIFTGEKGISLINAKGMLLEISAVAGDVGDSKTEVISAIEGEEINVGMNVFLIHQFLDVCETQETVIKFVSPVKPVLFQMKEYNNFHHIIMPVGL